MSGEGRPRLPTVDAADLTLERFALKEKGNLFEEVFGMKAVVRNAESTQGLVSDG